MTKTWQYIFLILLVVCSLNFFEFQAIKGTFVKYIQFAFLFGVFLLSLPYSFPRRSPFVFPIQLISFSVLLSIFISFLTWNQTFADGFAGTVLSLVWFSFFLLLKYKISIVVIERVLVCFGILYLFLFFYQFFNLDRNYFVDLENIDESRGITRIIFPGAGVFYFTTFLSLTRITTGKRMRWFWLVLLLLGCTAAIMQVTRQVVIGFALIIIYHFLKNFHFVGKIILLVLICLSIGFVFNSKNMLIVGMRDAQGQTVSEGSEYVRFKAANFFLFDFSKTPLNRIVGNGVPYGKASPYFRFYVYNLEKYGYWLNDVGIIAVYAMFGVFAVFGYFLIWYKSFHFKLPIQFSYLKYYLGFLLFTSFTSDSIYSYNTLISTLLILYIFHHLYFNRTKTIKGTVDYNP